jgi:epoxyqueuosine reductase
MAHEAGFDLVRFGPADLGGHREHFLAWLDAGRAGAMDYLHRNRERIAEPLRFAPAARSVMALAQDYGSAPVELAGGGRIARYARGRDYHRTLGDATRRLRTALERDGVAPGTVKVGTDAVPVLERALAVRAGIGFLAKSAMVISPQRGPYLFLSELLMPFELPSDPLATGTCGTCTRCIDACPTQAIVAPYQVDARRCLSYTTIEHRGVIPSELRAPQGEWLFGCDVCLEVCPFTRFANPRPAAPSLQPHRVVETFTLVGVLELSLADYDTHWVGTAMRRATRQGLRRNAAIVLGNRGDPAAVPALARALRDADPIVRAHAAWGLGRLAGGGAELQRARTTEAEPTVLAEIDAALAAR